LYEALDLYTVESPGDYPLSSGWQPNLEENNGTIEARSFLQLMPHNIEVEVEHEGLNLRGGGGVS
jgi:hypothetical protein